MEIKIIQQDLRAALVEWCDGEGLHRCIIPVSVVKSGEVTQYDLEAGQPYGEDWESFLKLPTAQFVARLLRDNGVWTFADLKGDVRKTRAALAMAYSKVLIDLLECAKSAEEG